MGRWTDERERRQEREREWEREAGWLYLVSQSPRDLQAGVFLSDWRGWMQLLFYFEWCYDKHSHAVCPLLTLILNSLVFHQACFQGNFDRRPRQRNTLNLMRAYGTMAVPGNATARINVGDVWYIVLMVWLSHKKTFLSGNCFVHMTVCSVSHRIRLWLWRWLSSWGSTEYWRLLQFKKNCKIAYTCTGGCWEVAFLIIELCGFGSMHSL